MQMPHAVRSYICPWAQRPPLIASWHLPPCRSPSARRDSGHQTPNALQALLPDMHSQVAFVRLYRAVTVLPVPATDHDDPASAGARCPRALTVCEGPWIPVRPRNAYLSRSWMPKLRLHAASGLSQRQQALARNWSHSRTSWRRRTHACMHILLARCLSSSLWISSTDRRWNAARASPTRVAHRHVLGGALRCFPSADILPLPRPHMHRRVAPRLSPSPAPTAAGPCARRSGGAHASEDGYSRRLVAHPFRATSAVRGRPRASQTHPPRASLNPITPRSHHHRPQRARAVASVLARSLLMVRVPPVAAAVSMSCGCVSGCRVS
ncbi:hypothetical protein DENSPDRAFT_425664 [Dentipellis sp. KUC8613]|nr:hypothetical protein DENSPDRAFT_425664 [Dentipellis sp. KUC8613]